MCDRHYKQVVVVNIRQDKGYNAQSFRTCRFPCLLQFCFRNFPTTSLSLKSCQSTCTKNLLVMTQLQCWITNFEAFAPAQSVEVRKYDFWWWCTTIFHVTDKQLAIAFYFKYLMSAYISGSCTVWGTACW